MKNIIKIFLLIKHFVKEYKVAITIVLTFSLIITLIKKCEKTPKETIKTVTKIVTIHDTITQVEIDTIYKIVNVEKIKNVKGETKIVYVDTSTNTSIEAKQYDTYVKSNDATADLKITTTGELLDVTGQITYPEKTITNTITKYKNKSGLFLYGSAPINTNYVNAEIGLFYQFKNTFGVMSGLEYNDLTKSANIKVGIAVKIY